jgi:hypothetical protein
MNEKAIYASDLIERLWPEVFQTEQSAHSHPAREAKRLGTSPPASAMRAVSHHAANSLSSLQRLTAARGHTPSILGRALGEAFSVARSFSSDLLMSRERSYRATVLGIHHGIGVFALLEDAATASGDQQLADYCAEWLAERKVLCEAAEDALAWFAEHPAVAAGRPFASNLVDQRATHAISGAPSSAP